MSASWAVWTLVLALDLASYFLARVVSPEWVGPFPPLSGVLMRVATWYSWWLWTPVVFYLALRFRFERGTLARSFVAHAVAAFAILWLSAAPATAIRWSMGLYAFVPFVSISSRVVYAAICGTAIILDLQRRERAHLVGAARLESQLTESRMHSLTAQLRPHFLYNALNGVAMLIRAGAHGQALEAVLGYSELLRHTLDAGPIDGPLRDELSFVDRYLSIERMRFSDTLSASILSEPDVADALVPNLVLQPLVENALRHGLSHMETNARLEVVASRHANALRLEVRDNGVGLPADWRLDATAGMGLRTTRSRLRERYGDQHHFELHSRLEGGTVVIIEIPFCTSATAGAA